jgi:hypothetical protein
MHKGLVGPVRSRRAQHVGDPIEAFMQIIRWVLRLFGKPLNENGERGRLVFPIYFSLLFWSSNIVILVQLKKLRCLGRPVHNSFPRHPSAPAVFQVHRLGDRRVQPRSLLRARALVPQALSGMSFLANPIAEARSKSVDRAGAGTKPPQGCLAKPLPAPMARKYKITAPDLRHSLDDLDRASRQWNPMLNGSFHPCGRNHPDFRIKVDFRPSRAQNLAPSCRRQNDEFEGKTESNRAP